MCRAKVPDQDYGRRFSFSLRSVLGASDSRYKNKPRSIAALNSMATIVVADTGGLPQVISQLMLGNQLAFSQHGEEKRKKPASVDAGFWFLFEPAP